MYIMILYFQYILLFYYIVSINYKVNLVFGNFKFIFFI